MFTKKVSEKTKNGIEKKEISKKGKGSIGTKILNICKVVVIPLLFAAVVSNVIYMAMENKVAEAQMKTNVVVMEKEVAANTTIHEEDVASYFKVVSVEQTAVPKSAYKSLSELPKGNFYIENAMDISQMVLKDDLATTDTVLDKYKSGYEVTAISADNFVGGVNGSVRKGDIVDIYAVDPATEELVLLVENVYVAAAYDNSGNKISEDDSVATSFNIYVTADEVASINAAITYGHVQMYLVTE